MQKNAKNMLAEVLSTFSTHQQPLHSREKLLQARMRRIKLARSQNSLEYSSGLKNYTTHDGNISEQLNISTKLSQHTAYSQNINWIKYNILVGIYKNWLRLAPYIMHLLQKDEKSKSKFNQVILHLKQKEKHVRYILKKDFNSHKIEQNNTFSNTKGQIIPNKKIDQNCQKLFQEYKIIKKQISSLTPWLQRNKNLEKQNDEVHNFLSNIKKLQSSHQLFKQTGHLKKASFISLKKIQLEAHQIENLVQNRLEALEQLQKCFDEVPKKDIQLVNKSLIELSKINEQNKQRQSQNSGILKKQQCLQLFDKMKKKKKQIRNDCSYVPNKSQQKENLQVLKTASATPNVLGLQNSDDERSYLALHSAQKYKTRNSFRPSKILNNFQKNDTQTKRQSIRKKPVNFESSIQQLQPIYLGDLIQNGIINITNQPQNTNPFVTKSKQRIKLLKKTIPLNKMMAEIKEQEKKRKIHRKQSNTAHQYQQDTQENEKGSSNSLYFKSNYLIKYKSKKHFQYASHDKMYKHRPSKDELDVIRKKTIQQQRISKSQDLDLIAESIDNESFQHVLKSKTRTKKFRKAKNSLVSYNGGRKSSSKDSDSYRQAKKDSLLKKLHQKKQYTSNPKRSSNLPYKIQYNHKFNDQQLNFKRKKIIDIHRYAIQDDRFEKEENIIRKKQIIINILKKMIEEGVLQNIDQEKRNVVQELIQKQCPDDYLLADFFDYEKLNKIKKVRRQAFFITNQNMNKQKSFYEYLNKLRQQLLVNTFDPEQLISINPNFRNRRDSKAYMDLTYNKKWKNQDQLSQSNKILNKNQNLYLQLVDQFINEFLKDRYELIQKKI